jgi:hypothetical protein
MAARVAAVLSVDVLDHLFAPLMLEVDVDVGRLASLLRDEALEQQSMPLGFDLGDAEAVAHGGLAAEPRPWHRISLRSARTSRRRRP